MDRRGFTLLELVLATLLASVITVAAFGLFGTLQTMDKNLQDRYEGMRDLGRVHATARLALQSMVAEPNSDVSTQADDGEEELSEEQLEIQNIDRSLSLLEARFRLGALDAYSEYDEDGPKRVVMAMTGHPLAELGQPSQPVRGAFDLIPGRDEQGRREWALFYTPVDPPGDPVLLVWDLELAEIAALDGDGWHSQFVANEIGDFPWAVRLVLWKRGGARADWVLEPGVRVMERLR